MLCLRLVRQVPRARLKVGLLHPIHVHRVRRGVGSPLTLTLEKEGQRWRGPCRNLEMQKRQLFNRLWRLLRQGKGCPSPGTAPPVHYTCRTQAWPRGFLIAGSKTGKTPTETFWSSNFTATRSLPCTIAFPYIITPRTLGTATRHLRRRTSRLFTNFHLESYHFRARQYPATSYRSFTT